jgi:hypothetical protein
MAAQGVGFLIEYELAVLFCSRTMAVEGVVELELPARKTSPPAVTAKGRP